MNGKLESAHQVKAKSAKTRSSYDDALLKSAAIAGDRIKDIARYFHVSVKLADSSDYLGANGETVKFYSYGSAQHCALNEIESLTKDLIKQIMVQAGITHTPNLIKLNFCLASEKISSKAVEIHAANQVHGESEVSAAYIHRINGQDIYSDISRNHYSDLAYSAAILKQQLHDHIEEKLHKSLDSISETQYGRTQRLFAHVRKMETSDLTNLCQLIKPSEKFSTVQKSDISRYTALMDMLTAEPIFQGMPHYLDKENQFYLPTAISCNNDQEVDECISHISQEIRENEKLISLLFEFNNLISGQLPRSFHIDSKFTSGTEIFGDDDQPKSDHITHEIILQIIQVDVAETILNASKTP